MIYFVQNEDGSGPVKIGYTRGRTAKKRLCSLQTGSPKRLKILATMPGGTDKESELHQLFRDSRLTGEWFDIGIVDVLAVVHDVGSKPERPFFEEKSPHPGSKERFVIFNILKIMNADGGCKHFGTNWISDMRRDLPDMRDAYGGNHYMLNHHISSIYNWIGSILRQWELIEDGRCGHVYDDAGVVMRRTQFAMSLYKELEESHQQWKKRHDEFYADYEAKLSEYNRKLKEIRMAARGLKKGQEIKVAV